MLWVYLGLRTVGWYYGAVGGALWSDGELAIMITGGFLISNACSYDIGRSLRDKQIQRRDRTRRMVEQAQPRPVASMPPTAGRLDASLPIMSSPEADTVEVPRVAPPTRVPVWAPPPRPAPAAELCARGAHAQIRLANEHAIGCMWCQHATPPGDAPGWVLFGGYVGVCPCCRHHDDR